MRTKLPELFLARLRDIFPPKRYHELVNTFAFKKPASFRVNTSKISLLEAKEQFAKYHLRVFPVSWYKEAYSTNFPLPKLQKLSFINDGLIFLQSFSSMVPPIVLNPQKGQIVLDMNVSLGARTLQMVNLMQNQGLIMAYNNDKTSVNNLLENISLHEAKNVVVRMKDPAMLWKEYPEYFDKILLAAPNSSEGGIDIHNSSTFNHWSEDNIAKMSHIQKKLIASGLVSLKVGGELVYSTDTFAPEENEGVIDWVIQMVGDRVAIEVPHLKFSDIGPAVLAWKGKSFARKTALCKRVLPDEFMEGFFVCKIRKIKEIKV